MTNNILIIGSTGKLGSKLFKYCCKNDIFNITITAYNNKRKLYKQKKYSNVKNSFCLNSKIDKDRFLKLLQIKKFKLIYFLDYGAQSLIYIDILLKKNRKSYFAIANKELLIAGGNLLRNKIDSSSNILIPLDSEHFSLYRSNPNNSEIDKLFITASGGPFYFKKKIDLNNVSFNEVINHPKWKMGNNNSIDSSNFINKILEIFEVSMIYKIEISKIDFLLSKEAFIHSVICYSDRTVSINCFSNNMLITLIKPLSLIFDLPDLKMSNSNYLNSNNLKVEKFNDNRFKIKKYINLIKSFDHKNQIKFMILNNIAHRKYVEGSLKYNNIINFIMNNIADNSKLSLNNFKNIVSYINEINLMYE